MKNKVYTQIIKIGNSSGIRIPKAYLNALGTEEVMLELIDNNLVISPVTTSVPPRSKWNEIMSKMSVSPDDNFADFDITQKDGLDDL
jgi:antitoxin MazE